MPVRVFVTLFCLLSLQMSITLALMKEVDVNFAAQHALPSFTWGVDRGPRCASSTATGSVPDSGASFASSLHSLGGQFIRTHDTDSLDWNLLYPRGGALDADPRDPSSYDWTIGDEYFARIVDNGFDPYFRLGTSFNEMGGGLPPAGVPYNQTA